MGRGGRGKNQSWTKDEGGGGEDYTCPSLTSFRKNLKHAFSLQSSYRIYPMLEGFSSQRSYLNSDQVSYTVFYCSSYFSFCNFFVFIHVFVHFFFHVFWFPSVVASPPPFQCFLFCTLFYTPCKCTFLLTISWILHYITLHIFSKFYFFSSISIFQNIKYLQCPIFCLKVLENMLQP